MTGINDVELAVGEPCVQELAVARRDEPVVATGDDLDGGCDVTESFGEDGEVRWVAAHVGRRLDEPAARVRREVVLAYRVGQGVPLDALKGRGDDVAPIDALKSRQVWGLDELFEGARNLKRERRAATSHDGAGETVKVLRRREQHRAGTDVGPYDVRMTQSPLVEEPQQERAHRAWRLQIRPPLGLAEARQIDGDQAPGLRQARPDRLPREETLRPRVEHQDRLVCIADALGVSDREAVGLSSLCAHAI